MSSLLFLSSRLFKLIPIRFQKSINMKIRPFYFQRFSLLKITFFLKLFKSSVICKTLFNLSFLLLLIYSTYFYSIFALEGSVDFDDISVLMTKSVNKIVLVYKIKYCHHQFCCRQPEPIPIYEYKFSQDFFLNVNPKSTISRDQFRVQSKSTIF